MAPVASKPVSDEVTPASVAAPAPTAAAPANDNVAHAIAGAGGGILSTVLTYPLITLSTRAQVESKRADSSFLAAVERIVAREGVSGLYAGLDSAVFGIGVTNFVYYYWYEWTRSFFERAAAGRSGRVAGRLTTVESMIAGAIAGSATVILTNPIWVVNTRMTTRRRPEQKEPKGLKEKDESEQKDPIELQDKEEEAGAGQASAAQDEEAVLVGDADEKKAEKAEKPEKPENTTSASVSSLAPTASPAPRGPAPTSTLGTLLALLREEGPQALFAGVVPALVLVINPILQYTLFEQLKNSLQARRRGKPFTPGMAFVLGALSKLFATGITYPYITVKSRMHVAKGQDKGGVTAALRKVIQEEGYAGLYKGIGPKITQSVLTAAFLFALKDALYTQTVRLRSVAAKKA